MKTLVIKVKESFYDKVKSFLEIMPKDTIEVVEDDFSHIDYVSDEEQSELENILHDKDTKIVGKSKNINF